jgi:hypothetical protein
MTIDRRDVTFPSGDSFARAGSSCPRTLGRSPTCPLWPWPTASVR